MIDCNLSDEQSSDDDLTISDLCDEFFERRDRGEQISSGSFAAQYPQFEETLRDALRGLELLTNFGATNQDADLPSEIAGCAVKRVIARGGMGIVLEATHPTVSRRLAIKLLNRHSEQHFQTRFQREAEAASRLIHPHIVPFVDCGEHQGRPYISMLYIDGESLDRILERHLRSGEKSFVASDFRRIAGIGADAASALSYAHKSGMIHRDIKPGNLILDTKGKIWVTDFGLAKLHDHDSELSRTGEMIGTARYMAPEQIRGIADERSDIYGLGVTLYELAAGEKAWGNTKCTVRRRRDSLLELPEITSVNEHVPEGLARIIMKACDPRPAARFVDATQMRLALTQFQAGSPVTAGFRRPVENQKASRLLAVLLLALAIAILLLRPSGNETEIVSSAASANRPVVSGQPATILVDVPNGNRRIENLALNAADMDDDPFSWHLTGGSDVHCFAAHRISGRVYFQTTPHVQSPHDADRDNVYDFDIVPSGRYQPHVAVFFEDAADGVLTLKEPATGVSRKVRLPARLQTITTLDGHRFLHTHHNNDGTIALYESVNSRSFSTKLIQSDSQLPSFLYGLAEERPGHFVAVVEESHGLVLQRFTLDGAGVFIGAGVPVPIGGVEFPVGLCCLAENDFLLIEQHREEMRLFEVAIFDGTAEVSELPAGWNLADARVCGLAGWLEIKPGEPEPTESITTVRVRVVGSSE